MKENTPAQNTQLKMIIWIALFISNFIYLGIIFYLPQKPLEAVEPDATLTTVLSLASIMMVVMSFVLPKFTNSTEENQMSDFSKFVLSLALNESASVFAFIIGFIFHDLRYALTLFAISILGFIKKFPRENSSID